MVLKVGDYYFDVELANNATVQKLLELLPLNAKMSELNGNEKYYYLDSNLPTNTQTVKQIAAGDIMLWGNNCLVIFYKSFASGHAYTRLGHIADITNLADALSAGDVKVSWCK